MVAACAAKLRPAVQIFRRSHGRMTCDARTTLRRPRVLPVASRAKHLTGLRGLIAQRSDQQGECSNAFR